jgi:4-amino-4-deoxy-L-arabinose transferase-like glycosyltransferase
MQTNERVFLMTVVAVALIVRLAAVGALGPCVINFGDGADYVKAATSVCSSGSYPDRSWLPFFRAPGLPFFVIAVTLCHTEMVWLVKAALALVDTMSVAIVFLLAEELFQDRRTSLFSAAGAAIYPFFIAQSSDVRTEALFMFFFLTSIWLTLRVVRSLVPHLALLAGVCASAAALVRPVGLVLLPLLAVTLIYLCAAKKNSPVRLLTWFAIGAAICLGPWVIRNDIRYHELILVNDAGGYNFWRGTSAEMAAIDRLADPQEFSAAATRFEDVTSPAIAREVEKAASTPSSRNREWCERAFATFAENPGAFGLRLARNAWVYWRPWLNPQNHSTVVVAASGLLGVSLYVFALMGWSLLWRRNRRLALWCAFCTLLFWIMQIPFQVVSRFRIPITDPFLIFFAVALLTAILRRQGEFRLHSKSCPSTPLPSSTSARSLSSAVPGSRSIESRFA